MPPPSPTFTGSAWRTFFAAPRNFWLHLLQSSRPRYVLVRDLGALDRYFNDREREFSRELTSVIEAKDDLDFNYAHMATLKGGSFSTCLHVCDAAVRDDAPDPGACVLDDGGLSMKIRLQQFGFKESNYERPNQEWVCGWAADGNPCRRGRMPGGTAAPPRMRADPPKEPGRKRRGPLAMHAARELRWEV